MRIIAGKYKRSTLLTLEGNDTRPTRDMVKEALFSSIDVEGKRVLDLFAGSGAIGLEALSRGASDAVFNDLNPEAVKIIRANLAKFNEKRLVLNKRCFEALDQLKGQVFDFVYLDPPYVFRDFEELFSQMVTNKLINDDSLIILEVEKKTELPATYFEYVNYKSKQYGINKLLYYRKETTGE